MECSRLRNVTYPLPRPLHTTQEQGSHHMAEDEFLALRGDVTGSEVGTSKGPILLTPRCGPAAGPPPEPQAGWAPQAFRF